MNYNGKELYWQYSGLIEFQDGTQMYLIGEHFQKYFLSIDKVRELIKKHKKKNINKHYKYIIEKRLVSQFEQVEVE